MRKTITRYSAPRNIETGHAPCAIRNKENRILQNIKIIPKIIKTNLELL
jgi:hypothetical protein